MAKTSMKMKQQAKPKFSTPLQNLRPSALSSQKVWYLQNLLPRTGIQGPDPGREESQLVIYFNLVNPQSGGKINDNERSYCRYAYKNP